MPTRSAVAFDNVFVRDFAAKGSRREARSDATTPGLELRATPNGSKSWAFRYRNAAGRSVRHRLGDFPAMSLKEARKAALLARSHVAKGGDPQREKKAQESAERARTVRTVRELASAYLDYAERHNRPSTVAGDRHWLKHDVLPKLGGHPIEAVTRAQVRELVNSIGRTGHHVTANRVGALVSKLYRYASHELDLVVENPASRMGRTFKEPTRERVLNDDELRTIWLALEDWPSSKMSAPMAFCLMLCALTLQRRKDVCGFDLSELDLEQRLWIIPGARTKNHREHVVPLPPQALAVIERARALLAPSDEKRRGSGPLFPSPRDATRSFTPSAVTRAMSRLCDIIGVDDAGPHDLRRTGTTNITGERIGISRFTVALVLNHISETGGITGIYDRNGYMREKRSALEGWANLLSSIAANTPREGNVVVLAGVHR